MSEHKKKMGRPASGKPWKPVAFQIKGDPGWKSSVEGMAEARKIDASTFIEEAVAFYASHLRFPNPAPR